MQAPLDFPLHDLVLDARRLRDAATWQLKLSSEVLTSLEKYATLRESYPARGPLGVRQGMTRVGRDQLNLFDEEYCDEVATR